ncbi:MAG: hypothetical protein KBS64_07160 [Treponema sp.]|nr:hypothetical protein [Candidatus Treponema equi]
MKKVNAVRNAMAALVVPVVMLSCRLNVSYDPDKIRKTDFDINVIPDRFNTGAREGTIFNKIMDSGFIAENVFLTFRSDMNPPAYMITSYGDKNRDKLPDKVVVRDYDFSDYSFIISGSDRYPKNKHIIFENCRFKGFRNDASAPDAKRVYITFNNCSFSGGVNSSYITLNNCKIGGFTSDAMNPLREFYANNVYVYDLFHEAIDTIVHVDGIQIYGDQRSRNNVFNDKWISAVETGEIHFKNIRFEIPSIHFDGMASGTGVNACVMFQLEFSDVDNVSFDTLYVNGGGKWFPLYMDHGKNNERSVNGQWSHKNLSMSNVMVSNNFGKIFYSDLLEDAEIINVEHHDMLFVSSVWKSADGKAHMVASNDTKSDKTLIVKSDVGTFEFKIPHCPSNWVLGGELNGKVETDEELVDEDGRSYMTYRWQDMPFDLEFEIPGNPKFVVCYQGEEQIRYVSFDGRNHYFSEIHQ